MVLSGGLAVHNVRTRTVAALVTLLSLFGMSEAPSAVAGNSPMSLCAPKGAAVLAEDASAQIYATRAPDSPQHGYICKRGSTRRYALRYPQEARAWPVLRKVDAAALAFPLFAFSWSGGQVDTGASGIVVGNFLSNKYIRVHPALREGNGQAMSVVPRIVLKSNGSVAWVGMSPPFGADPGSAGRFTELAGLDAGGFELFSEGPDIKPKSLSLTGSTLAWYQEGERRSATLR